MNTCALRTWATALLCAALLPVQASAVSNREWRFEVFLDDKAIGMHNFHLNSQEGTHQLRSKARMRVKVMRLTLYDYTHQSHELWQDGCLQRIDASTDDNGKDFFVRGRRSGERMSVENHAGTEDLSGCVMSFAYWNPAILEQHRLLNAQTGEYLDVSVQELGQQTLQMRDHAVRALRYRIATGESDIELWYSEDGDWLGLRSSTRGGRQLHYRRVTEPVMTRSDSDE